MKNIGLMERDVSQPNEKFSAPINLKRVRDLFAVPARTEAAAFLYQEIASRMDERLSLVKLSPSRVVDMGCGSGRDRAILSERFPESDVIGLDASFAALGEGHFQTKRTIGLMARIAHCRLFFKSGLKNKNARRTSSLCGNFAQTPLSTGSADLIWSNLAVHWHPQPDQVFKEWWRVVRPNGLLMFSCFGPDTLKEVRRVFQEVDETPHTLPFVDMHDLGDMLIHAGFATPVMDMEKITLTYTSVEQLMEEVRALGGNPLTTRRKSLLGKRAWTRVVQALEATRDSEGRIALSFEIIYGHAFRPLPRVTSAGETIVRMDWPQKK